MRCVSSQYVFYSNPWGVGLGITHLFGLVTVTGCSTTGKGSGIFNWSPLQEIWAWQLYLRKCWNPRAAATPVVPVITSFPSLVSETYSKVSRSRCGPRLEFTFMTNLEAYFGIRRAIKSLTACSCTSLGVLLLMCENCLNLEV